MIHALPDFYREVHLAARCDAKRVMIERGAWTTVAGLRLPRRASPEPLRAGEMRVKVSGR